VIDSTRHRTVYFSSRFSGPLPEWANGGVVAGTLAAELSGRAVMVRLERPIPVEASLQLVTLGDIVELRDAAGDRLAFATNAELDRTAIVPFVGVGVAAATTPIRPRDGHPAGGCFACGPAHPTGLDLQPGPVPDGSCLATVLHVRKDLVDGGNAEMTLPVVWAALDCPGWFAGCGGEMALLGTMTAEQFAPIRSDDDIVVQAWHHHSEGRKAFVGSALYSTEGTCLAAATAVWIATPQRRDPA
jgi:hypothetical protein